MKRAAGPPRPSVVYAASATCSRTVTSCAPFRPGQHARYGPASYVTSWARAYTRAGQSVAQIPGAARAGRGAGRTRSRAYADLEGHGRGGLDRHAGAGGRRADGRLLGDDARCPGPARREPAAASRPVRRLRLPGRAGGTRLRWPVGWDTE